MNKGDAIRKVQGCLALANRTTNEEEREHAMATAIKIRLKWGISEAELTATELSEADGFELFGHRIFFYANHMAPHVDRIAAEIDTALAEADKLDLEQRMKAYCGFYLDVRSLIETRAQWHRQPGVVRLQVRRDEAIKAYYQAEVKKYREDHDDPDEVYVHRHAIFNTTLYSDLRTPTIEKIVGVYEKQLWAKIIKEQEETAT